MQLLVDVLTGQLGDDQWHKTASKIVRTFVCGNSLSLDTQDKEIEKKVKFQKWQVLSKGQSTYGPALSL